MRQLFLILLALSFYSSYSQFAIIQDKEGFVNIRSSAEIKNNIVDTLKNGIIVWCFDEQEGNWIYVDYQKKGNIQSGYIHKSRVKHLSTFDTIPIYGLDKISVIHQKDSFRIAITAKAFARENNKLKYDPNNKTIVSQINGKDISGTDGEIPKRMYKEIQVVIGKKVIKFPSEALENLFEPNLEYSKCYYDKQNDILYITAMNSDGAGGYVVVWIVEKGKFRNRFITHGV